jgi:hypothetical protein
MPFDRGKYRMTIKTDKSGHLYTDVGNIRIAYIPRQSRNTTKDWANSDVIRISAYKQDPNVSQAMHRGAELPIEDARTFIALMSSLCAIFNAGQGAQATPTTGTP